MGLSLFALLTACQRPSAPVAAAPTAPAPVIRVDAEIVVRATNAAARCEIVGSMYAPRQERRDIADTRYWAGTVTVQPGDLVVVAARANGREPEGCELRCTLRQAGAAIATDSVSNGLPEPNPPTCRGHSPSVTCVLQAQR
jgi:hypothetical protein